MDSLVLPIDLQAEYVSSWVREEGDVEDEDDLDVEEDGTLFSLFPIHSIVNLCTASVAYPLHLSGVSSP